MKKFIIILLLISAAQTANALDIVMGTGGYLGDAQAGFGSKRFTFLLGLTKSIGQFSVKYEETILRYFTLGGFITYSPHDSAFLYTGKEYPSRTYYPGTAVRSGFSFGIRFKMLYISTNINDIGLQYIINEEKYRNNWGWTNRHLWSTAVGLRFTI